MRTINMTLDIALRIVNWRYDSPYDLYNMSQSDGDLAELLNGQYAAVVNDGDEIVGFYCFGNSAQVPA
ncbi:MAG: GNAT family N-acetyltransferase, partial [Nitrososphaerota archaeon]|nr:GNAT family N-acetyltransferase [Nitrososphaerota archaeon]